MVTHAEIRAFVRHLFKLPPETPAGKRVDRAARRRARLDADAREWAKAEADEREQREREWLIETETTRARLERAGALFPGDL